MSSGLNDVPLRASSASSKRLRSVLTLRATDW